MRSGYVTGIRGGDYYTGWFGDPYLSGEVVSLLREIITLYRDESNIIALNIRARARINFHFYGHCPDYAILRLAPFKSRKHINLLTGRD